LLQLRAGNTLRGKKWNIELQDSILMVDNKAVQKSDSNAVATKKPRTLAMRRLAVEWAPFRKNKGGEEGLIKKILRSTPLFEKLSTHDWRLMSDLFHIREYVKDELIFEKGTPGLGMYVIVSGRVRIATEEDGEEVTLAILTDGDFFGEMSLIDEIERSASAVADCDTKLVGLFRPQLQELMTHRPRLGIMVFERLSQIVVKRLRESNRMLSQKVSDYEAQDE